MRYLGIDFGSNRIGVAVSDRDGSIAFPKAVEKRDAGLVKRLCALVRDESVHSIVMGDTRTLLGTANDITTEAERFAEELRAATGIPVVLANEAWTSVEAARYAPESRVHDDASAAAIILQRFLDMKGPVYHGVMEEISYDDFAKLDIRIGTVRAAERVPETDKLLKCTIDFGKLGERTIVSGIAGWKTPEELVGMQLPYIVNLAPRMLRGVESQGMLLAASDEDGVALLRPERTLTPGTRLT